VAATDGLGKLLVRTSPGGDLPCFANGGEWYFKKFSDLIPALVVKKVFTSVDLKDF
jgi:hypothetical protein